MIMRLDKRKNKDFLRKCPGKDRVVLCDREKYLVMFKEEIIYRILESNMCDIFIYREYFLFFDERFMLDGREVQKHKMLIDSIITTKIKPYSKRIYI
jgi:hypothetical protein